MHPKKCTYCKKGFMASRSDAKFCKDACRVGMNKLPKRMKEKADIAIDYIAQMRELAENYPELTQQMDEQLARVQEKVALLRLKAIS